MNKNEEDIIRYLENDLSPNEKIAFESMMDKSPEFRKEVEDFAFIWRTSSELKLHDKVKTVRNWDKISTKIKREQQKIRFLKIIRTSAAILLLPILIFSGYLYFELKDLHNESAQQLEVMASSGMVSKVTLPDGSEVWINSKSRISYPQKFVGKRRQVNLSGEAYFKVASSKSHPFDVILDNGLTVSAYGTEFNIDSYSDESTIKVTLVDGNVNVNDTNEDLNIRLNKGEQLLYKRDTKEIKVSDVNLFVETAWKDGKIVFRRTGMEDVVRRLSRHFNVVVQLKDKELYEYEYSATFTDENLSEILDLLSRTAPIEYKILHPKSSTEDSSEKTIVILSLKRKAT